MDIEKLTKETILKNMTPAQQKAVLDSVSESVKQSREVRSQKVAENIDLVMQALKNIEAKMLDRVNQSASKVDKVAASVKNGKDGKDGKDGRDGKAGAKGDRGADGKDGRNGIDGRNGEDGKDGVSVRNAFIDFDNSLVIELTNGEQINVGEVINEDLAAQVKIIANGGGTSQSVLDAIAALQAQMLTFLPDQTGNAGKYLTTDGTSTSWANIYGGLNYQGSWNASTNTPTLTSSVGDNGKYYVVSVSGSTNLNGITDWVAGDWAIFNGTSWQKIDQTNLVTSVNGQTGAVTITAAGLGVTQATPTVSGTVYGYTDAGTYSPPATVSGCWFYQPSVNSIYTDTLGSFNGATGPGIVCAAGVSGAISVGKVLTLRVTLISTGSVVSVNVGTITSVVIPSTQDKITITFSNTSIDWSLYLHTNPDYGSYLIVDSLLLTGNRAENAFLGYQAGSTITTGGENVVLGAGAGASLITGVNNIVIGTAADATGDVSNEITLGNSSHTKTRLFGSMALGGSAEGTSGQVLTSQGAGTTPIWTTPTSASGLPTGGTAGQILSKIDATNYNAQWIDNYATQLKMQAKNTTGSTLAKGTVVYISGASGANPFMAPAKADSDATSATTIGILESTVVNNGFGLIVEDGVISGIDTSAAAEGDPVWLSGTTAGGMIFGLANKPQAPIHIVYLGTVTRAHAVNGEIQVKINNGWELEELHDVLISAPVAYNMLRRNSANTLWENIPGPTSMVVGTTDTQTLTNKTINGSSNTLSNIGNSSLTYSSITINGTAVSLGGSISVGSAANSYAYSWFLA